MKIESVKAWLELQDEQFFATVSESIARDRGVPFEPDMVYASFETWMNSKMIKNRGHFATCRENKIFFIFTCEIITDWLVIC